MLSLIVTTETYKEEIMNTIYLILGGDKQVLIYIEYSLFILCPKISSIHTFPNYSIIINSIIINKNDDHYYM